MRLGGILLQSKCEGSDKGSSPVAGRGRVGEYFHLSSLWVGVNGRGPILYFAQQRLENDQL